MTAQVSGLIAHLGLSNWWLRDLTQEERERVLHVYRPLGSEAQSLIAGNILSTSQSSLHILWGLLSWFTKPEDYSLAKKIIQQAELLTSDSDVIDAHFFYQQKLEVAYRNRDAHSEALALAIEACRQQIAISAAVAKAMRKSQGPELPSHKGFEQLCIILERQNRPSEVIALCERATKEGWSGNWQARIARARKKI